MLALLACAIVCSAFVFYVKVFAPQDSTCTVYYVPSGQDIPFIRPQNLGQPSGTEACSSLMNISNVIEDIGKVAWVAVVLLFLVQRMFPQNRISSGNAP